MYVRLLPKQLVAATLTLALSSGAFAAGQHGGGHGHGGSRGHGASIGEAGKASEATRTIEIVMTDNRYSPERISVENGETIRFVVKNKGEFVHEFNIGTAAMHAAHQKEMATMFDRGLLEVDKIHHDRMKMGMGMAHDDANSVLLEPGAASQIVWKFGMGLKLEFACNLPGHYQSGMRGEFDFK
jgi:uncharacterized cupredoxin-like copper-binding protein